MAGHDVRVHIDGIHRVADGDFVFGAENIEDVAAIAFGAVADENFIVGNLHSPVAKIIFGNRGAQPVVALLRAIALEGFAHGHFVHGPVHGGNHGRRQRFGHVADAAADEAFGRIGVGLAKSFHPPADFREQIPGLEFQVMIIEKCHVSLEFRIQKPE